MAITNAEMAEAWGELLELTPEQITQLAGLLDQWALGGARLATLARLTTDVSTFNDAAIRMVHDWYGGEATGGPNGDGLYPLMNSDAEVFLVPSPAKIMAGVSGLDAKGELDSTDDLPATGSQGDLWVVSGVAWVWSASAAAWVDMGPWRGPHGLSGVISDVTITMLDPGAAPIVEMGGTPSDRTLEFGFPPVEDGADGANGWTPVTAEVPDGVRVVKQIVDWIGGTGPKPPTGKFVGPTGWVDTAAEATNVRGPGGAGSGDVVGPASSTNNGVAIWDGTSGKLLSDGPAIGVGAAGDLLRRLDGDGRYLLATLLGAANGVMPLGSDGKASTTFLPDAVLGALRYQGTWNATTNTPNIPAAATGNRGWYFSVNVAGTTSVGGITEWEVGDWLVSNGTAWEKIDNTDAVISVAGLKGIITAAALRTALDVYTKTQVDGLIPGFATVADLWANTAWNLVVLASVLNAAAVPQAITTTSGSIAINFKDGFNRKLAATGNFTLANATNKRDRSFSITVTNPNATTTASFGTDWKRSPGSPSPPTAENAKYDIVARASDTEIQYSIVVLG
jgi:hypothetical protein